MMLMILLDKVAEDLPNHSVQSLVTQYCVGIAINIAWLAIAILIKHNIRFIKIILLCYCVWIWVVIYCNMLIPTMTIHQIELLSAYTPCKLILIALVVGYPFKNNMKL